MLDLPEECRLPALSQLESDQSQADVRVAWNARGLAVQASVTSTAVRTDLADAAIDAVDGLHVWIDTRDTRTIHRATRFCHRYSAVLAQRGRGLGVEVDERPIHRALESPPRVRADRIAHHAQRTAAGWLIELFFPTESLHGFDPETNRRLGFYYQITFSNAPSVFLTVGRDFPIAEDPSLWATLELVEPSLQAASKRK